MEPAFSLACQCSQSVLDQLRLFVGAWRGQSRLVIVDRCLCVALVFVNPAQMTAVIGAWFQIPRGFPRANGPFQNRLCESTPSRVCANSGSAPPFAQSPRCSA